MHDFNLGDDICLFINDSEYCAKVSFIGRIRDCENEWIGVTLNRAVGSGDGTIDGIEYFKCDPNFGLFFEKSKVIKVRIGDQLPSGKSTEEFEKLKEEYENYREEMSEALELSTIDKEISQEKFESLLANQESLELRNEEMAVELEILREEIENAGGLEEVCRSRLSEEIVKLNDALLLLKDMYESEKRTTQAAVEDARMNHEKLSLMTTQNEKRAAELREKDSQIEDLKGQIDDLSGSELMISRLVEKVSRLEEQLEEMNAENRELAEINGLNEELIETLRQDQLDLTNDYESVSSQVERLSKQLQHMQMIMRRQQDTIDSLKEDKEDYRYDYQAHYSLSKTNLSIVESELCIIELAHSRRYIDILESYFPPVLSREMRGTSMLHLSFLRLASKCQLFMTTIQNKAEVREQLTARMVESGFFVEIKDHSQLMLVLAQIDSLLDQLASFTARCSPEELIKLSTLMPQLLQYEDTFDRLLVEVVSSAQTNFVLVLNSAQEMNNFLRGIIETHQGEETASLRQGISVIASAVGVIELTTCAVLAFVEAAFFKNIYDVVDRLKSTLKWICSLFREESTLVLPLDRSAKLMETIAVMTRMAEMFTGMGSALAVQASFIIADVVYPCEEAERILDASLLKGAFKREEVADRLEEVEEFALWLRSGLENGRLPLKPAQVRDCAGLSSLIGQFKEKVESVDRMRQQLEGCEQAMQLLRSQIKERDGQMEDEEIRRQQGEAERDRMAGLHREEVDGLQRRIDKLVYEGTTRDKENQRMCDHYRARIEELARDGGEHVARIDAPADSGCPDLSPEEVNLEILSLKRCMSAQRREISQLRSFEEFKMLKSLRPLGGRSDPSRLSMARDVVDMKYSLLNSICSQEVVDLRNNILGESNVDCESRLIIERLEEFCGR